jgi:hypothetical protein
MTKIVKFLLLGLIVSSVLTNANAFEGKYEYTDPLTQVHTVAELRHADGFGPKSVQGVGLGSVTTFVGDQEITGYFVYSYSGNVMHVGESMFVKVGNEIFEVTGFGRVFTKIKEEEQE